jgi:hypothetical protein
MVPSRKEDFLNALGESTREVYRIGLNHCEEYLKTRPEFSGVEDPLYDFLRLVKEDKNLDVLDMQFLERGIIKALFAHFKKKGYANKSILAYVAALQSFGKYYQVPLSTKFTDPPSGIAVNEKCEWTLESLGKFIESMESAKYQSLSVTLLQSALRPSDVLGENLPYKLIQEEFEAGITPVCIPIKSSEKTEIRHRTFLGSLAVQKMKLYFKETGVPKPEDPIYPIDDRSVEAYFANCAKNQFPPWEGQNPYSPYSIRGSACTFLSDALCPESAIEYFSGHNLLGDVKLRYRRRSTDKWRTFYKNFEWALDYAIPIEARPRLSLTELRNIIASLTKDADEAL